jgi:energy-coupling factor transporter transmembrane protein EcfT
VIVGWFAALFTAHLPEGIARFLHRVVQYHVRLLSYLYLMRDEYPPFRLSNDTYPVHLETNPGRLNRWAVLFRLILVFPVFVLSNWVGSGLFAAGIVIWIVVLAKGRMPSILAQAVAAVLRFDTRVFGYTMLLSSAYPSGLYGDRSVFEEELAASATPEPGLLPAAPPRTAKLYLARGARRLVTTFLVLGIVFSVANNVASFTVDDADSTMGAARVEAPTNLDSTKLS